jgi:hypothetical protein
MNDNNHPTGKAHTRDVLSPLERWLELLSKLSHLDVPKTYVANADLQEFIYAVAQILDADLLQPAYRWNHISSTSALDFTDLVVDFINPEFTVAAEGAAGEED